MSDSSSNARTVLQLPEFRWLLLARFFGTLAASGLVVIIGYQVYELTKDPLALGGLGLVEAIPALTLALFAGHFADRHDRRRILLVSQVALTVCSGLYAFISLNTHLFGLAAFYAVAFVVGMARGFANPAGSAFEAQVIPEKLFASAASLLTGTWYVIAIIGPASAGWAYANIGPVTTYGIIAVLMALALIGFWQIAPKPLPPFTEGESIWQSIYVGVRFVRHDEILLGSMALDLFAVLFGGAIALLPIFASDILKVGPEGYGLLLAAPAIGALAATIFTANRPPLKQAGPILLACVAGFGVSMIVFGFSQNFVLSLVALAASGFFDGISVVIRFTILRMFSPEAMRARIAAVQWIFIGASNEVGAFESGVAAKALGTVPSVVAGGIVTLLVVAAVQWRATRLRRLNLEEKPVFAEAIVEG
jgi:MFS family permease